MEGGGAVARGGCIGEGSGAGRGEGMETGRAGDIGAGRAEGWETGRAEGIAEGEARGEVRGTLKTLVRLVRDGLVSVQDAAASAGVDADEIRRVLAAGDGTQTSSGGSLRRQSPST